MAPIRKPPVGQLPASQNFEWSALKYLLAVAETGNLTRAAERLQTTQPTVSKRIEELEHRLGVELVVRGQTGAVLTEAGRAALVHAVAIERSVQAIYQDVAMRDAEAAGEVSLRCPDGMAAYILAPHVARFQRAFPGIRLTLQSWTGQHAECDLSIQFEESRRINERALPLGWLHYVHFAADDYLELYGGMRSVVDIMRHRVLTHTNLHAQEERWQPKIKSLRDVVDHAVRTDCSTFLINAVTHGAGVASMPTYLANFEPKLRDLDTGEHARVRFWLVFDQQRGELPRMRETIKWLTSVFHPRSNPWFREEFIPPSEFAAELAEQA